MKTLQEYLLLLKKTFPNYKFTTENNVIEIDLKKDVIYKLQLEWEILKVLYPFSNFNIK